MTVQTISSHGLTGYSNHGCRCETCRHARREYDRGRRAANAPAEARKQQRRQRHRKQIEAIKLERGCADCGYRQHPSALDFHHERGVKAFSLGGAESRSWDSILLEIEKCDVLCANCHRIRHTES